MDRGTRVKTKGRNLVVLPCACANLRRAARVVSQFYEEELRGSGVRGTQFTLLQALAQVGGISQGQLGAALGIDSTTLTRTLATLRRKGWIEAERGDDRRQLRLLLTPMGKRALDRAMPRWQAAQTRLRGILGEAQWDLLLKTTVRTVELIPVPAES